MKHIFSKILLLCFGLLALTACVSDEEEVSKQYGEKVKVSFSVATVDNERGNRAPNEGQYVATVEPWELIHSYRVVITDNSGTIVALVDKTFADKNTVEYDPVDIELRTGTYKAYAFANIPTSYFSEANGLKMEKGAKLPSLTAVRYYAEEFTDGDELVSVATYKAAYESKTAPAKYIPMTSINGQTVEVTGRVNQTFGIEVRRLFAKLQFDFRYPMASAFKTLNLNSQAVSNLTANVTSGGGVKSPGILFMNYEGLIENEDRTADLDLPAEYDGKTLSYTFATPVSIAPQGAGIKTTAASTSFYVLESRANRYTNTFELSFNLTEKGSSETKNMRYGITDPTSLTRIHRNDWILIPVTIGEWLMDLEVYAYPPIGGYPEAKLETSDEEFHVTFSSPGDIAIYPLFEKYYAPSTRFYLTDFDHVKSVAISEPQGTNIFTKKPAYKSGEILASLSNTKGTCYIEVTVEFYPDPANTSVFRTIKRRIYITLKK